MVSNKGNTNYSQLHDEISIRQLLILAIVYLRLILKRWYLIVLGFLLLGGYKYYTIAEVKPTFPAKVQILIESQDIARENKHKVKVYSQLVQSPSLLKSVLFEEVKEADSTNLLINIYLKTYFKIKPDELDPEIPVGFQIKHREISQTTQQERMVIKKILDKIGKPKADFTDGFVSISVDEELGFITINLSTPNEALSLLMLNEIYDQVKVLLNDSNSFADQKAYTIFQKETDSLSASYKQTYYQLNRFRDKRERLIQQENPPSKELKYFENKIHQLEVLAEVYKIEYLATVEQLKIAQLDHNKNALLIHELERTIGPITSYAPHPVIIGIKFGIFGAALAFVLIFFSRVFSNLSKELSNEKEYAL